MSSIDYLLLPLRVAKEMIERADWLYYAYHGLSYWNPGDFGDAIWIPRWVYIPIAFVVSFFVVEIINLVRLTVKLVKRCSRQFQN